MQGSGLGNRLLSPSAVLALSERKNCFSLAQGGAIPPMVCWKAWAPLPVGFRVAFAGSVITELTIYVE
jgi:hypothetical protein